MQRVCAGPVQTPPWHRSPWVQALPSLQAVPSGLFGLVHAPVAGSHVPGSWHCSDDWQMTGFEPVHAPAWHVSLRVQEFPSLHRVPSAFAGLEHVPVAGLHVPAEWQASCAVQLSGLVPRQTPVWHVSVRVQALPSLQDDPLALFGFEQTPVEGLQVPATWH